MKFYGGCLEVVWYLLHGCVHKFDFLGGVGGGGGGHEFMCDKPNEVE